MGVKTVPFLLKTSMKELHMQNVAKGLAALEYDEEKAKVALMELADKLCKGPSTIDPQHIREGIVVRIDSGLINKSYKHKSFEFKVLEGIVKDAGIVDQEEVESLS